MNPPVMDDSRSQPDRSLGEIVSAITARLSELIRGEVALAKAEARESAKRAGVGAGMLAGAGVSGHMVLIFLSLTLLGLLETWTDNFTLSALIVAIVWAVIATVLGVVGRNKLKEVEGMPQTVETAKRIPDALKGNEDQR